MTTAFSFLLMCAHPKVERNSADVAHALVFLTSVLHTNINLRTRHLSYLLDSLLTLPPHTAIALRAPNNRPLKPSHVKPASTLEMLKFVESFFGVHIPQTTFPPCCNLRRAFFCPSNLAPSTAPLRRASTTAPLPLITKSSSKLSASHNHQPHEQTYSNIPSVLRIKPISLTIATFKVNKASLRLDHSFYINSDNNSSLCCSRPPTL